MCATWSSLEKDEIDGYSWSNILLKHKLCFCRLINIEKDINSLLFNKRSDFKMEYGMLEELEYKLTKNRKEESNFFLYFNLFIIL